MDLPTISSLEQEIDFKNLSGLTFKNCNAIRTIIRNSIISECLFKDVNLSHCDLLSTKIHATIFNRVSFDGADIFSMWFSGCQFINADFTGAGIEDVTFLNCTFQNCIFDGVGLKECTFTNSHFQNIKPDSSTFTLNDYEKCTFCDCVFKGSFFYQIFKKCQFKDVSMDCNILKYNFGLGKISGITYFHKSCIIQDADTLRNDLIIQCSDQKLFINAVIIDYNFSDEINPELAIKSIKAVGIMIENDILLRNDELTFLKKLYHHLYVSDLIAPIVLYRLFEELKKICTKEYPENIVISKSRESLYMISNSLYFDFSDFCERLRSSISEKIDYIAPIQIQMHYNREPQIPLDTLLNQYFPGIFHRTATENGSFLEYLEAGEIGLEILKIFIQLLGISVPIIYAELKEKRKKKPPKTTIQKDVEINITQAQNQKDTAELIQKTCQLLNASDMLTGDQQGYNNSNIKEIKVSYRINIQA